MDTPGVVGASLAKKIIAVCGSQMAKTDTIANCMGHRLEDDPAPLLYLGPTRSFVEGTWEPRFRAMVKSASRLWSMLWKGKNEKKILKIFAGIKVRFGWAGSATEIAGDPAAIVFVDERDRMDDNVAGEGDPVGLADARHSTYPDGKTVVTSTPTLGNVNVKKHPETGLEHWEISDDVQSQTWKLWQQGSRHEFAWPCPDCGDFFVPRFRWLYIPPEKEFEHIEPASHRRFLRAQGARLQCPHCDCLIDDNHKTEMLERGVPVAPGQRIEQDGTITDPNPRPNYIISLWVSGLCSPWKSFTDRALEWLEAVDSGDPEKVQTVLNTGFGELYAVSGDAPPPSVVKEHVKPYKMGTVPPGTVAMTCGVDVQKNRLVYAVRAWGVGLESWLVERGELHGATDEPQVWDDLALMRDRFFGAFQVKRMFIDSGYRTSHVYDFCRRFIGWAFPTKGRDTMDAPLKTSGVEVTGSGKRMKGGLHVWNVNSDYFKRWLHERIERNLDLPGGWWIPEDIDDDYCEQIVAEARIVKPSGKVIWVVLNSNNHFLDVESLNIAAAYSLHLHMLTEAPRGPGSSGGNRGGIKEEAPQREGADPFAGGGRGGEFESWFNRD